MTGAERSGVVVYGDFATSGGIDAIDAYSRHLVDALCAQGVRTGYIHGDLGAVLAKVDSPPRWIVLQYNPFGYGRWGMAPQLISDAIRVRRRWPFCTLVLCVHEAWVSIDDWRSALMGTYQRAQLRCLLRAVDGAIVVRETLRDELGNACVHMPVGSNITPVPVDRDSARDRLGIGKGLVIALFGRRNPSRALVYATAAIAAVAADRGMDRLCVLNLGSDSPIPPVPAGVEVRSPGPLSDEDLSMHLHASDVLLLPFSDGLSTRRGTLMAGLAHGLPVVGLRGFNTDRVLLQHPDAMVLTPQGDLDAYALAVVELARDAVRTQKTGAAARELYERLFDWPVLARSVLATLEACARPGAIARS